MIKVLSFGHIPSSAGGLQSSGLANVIYQLALNASRQKGIDMILAATDVFIPETNINGLKILGWTKAILIKHMLIHPLSTIRILIYAVSAKAEYKSVVSLPGLILKSAFLDFVLRKIKPDIVHLHGASSILYFPVVPRRCKIVVTLHGNVGNDDNLPNKSAHAKMERLCCQSARITTLCTISTRIPEILRNMYGRIVPPVKVILNAYDDKVFFEITPVFHEKLTLCTVASFSKVKGQERVLDAVIESRVPYRYVCVGHFPEVDRIRLEEKATAGGIDFTCHGVKKPSEIREIFATCDYMILPSSSEGFGLVYLEAIACGVPVIIPRNLPLALEGDILSEDNAIRIDDCSVEAIMAVLPELKNKKFEYKKIASTVVGYTWDHVAMEYARLFYTLIYDI